MTQHVPRMDRSDERPVDVVPMWTGFFRKLHPLRIISKQALQGPFEQGEFLRFASALQRAARASDLLRDKTVALWQLEKLGFALFRGGQPGTTLDDGALPREIQPIAHVGLGVAAMESSRFEPERIAGYIERRAHPDYRLFPYETIGCIWAVYENAFFRTVFRAVSRARIPHFDLPNWERFVGCFDPGIRRLVAHGRGRTLFFKDLSVGRSVRSALRLAAPDVPPAVQGIAFAYAMVNHRDLERVLEVGRDLVHPEVAQAFRNGLVYALAFWEWAFPGFLGGVTPRSPRQAELVDAAWSLIGESRARGHLVVFGIA